MPKILNFYIKHSYGEEQAKSLFKGIMFNTYNKQEILILIGLKNTKILFFAAVLINSLQQKLRKFVIFSGRIKLYDDNSVG